MKNILSLLTYSGWKGDQDPMQILIKSAKVTDPHSPFNGKTVSLFIENGIIRKIVSGKTVPPDGTIELDIKGLHISPGFFDLWANFRDPGQEFKEDLQSGCAAAAAGGFTGVALSPGTQPAIQSKADIEYVRKKSSSYLVELFPYGAISKNLEGKELTEMYDQHMAGAVAFSDDKHSVDDAGLLLRALLYARNFNGLLAPFCQDNNIALNGQMNEGKVSTSLGLKGIPAVAEEVMVQRNIFLCEYTGGKLHIPFVSTAGSVELIRRAKKKGLKITASVNAHHLALDDSALEDFDSNYKVLPPLRDKKDVLALKKGLADGTIDAICSDHRPEDIENKNVEFDYAAFGMSSIEITFSLALTYGKLSLPELIKKIAINPRHILGLPIPKIKIGEKANFTLFVPDQTWTVQGKDLRSRSANNPFIGKKLKGRIMGVFHKGLFELFD